MDYKFEIASLYEEILMEDYQSSSAQALKILQGSGYGEGDLDKIQDVYNNVRINDPNQRPQHKDINVPVLAFFYIGTGGNIDTVRNEYQAYINSPRATGQNLFSKFLQNIQNEIRTKQLFKPDKQEEKIQLIRSMSNQLAADIHKYQAVKKDDTAITIDDSKDVAYQDDNITVYLADSKAKCIYYGRNSNLCISTRSGENYYWRYRMGNMREDGLGMTTYFVYWNNSNGKKRILIDALGDEEGPADEYSWNPISPNDDSDIAKDDLIARYPELEPAFEQDVFEFIPYGENEKRFQYIDDNVNSITKLSTLEDFEMFVEADKDIDESDWEYVASKVPKEQVADLLMKYGMLLNLLPKEFAQKYLSNSQYSRYIDKMSSEAEGVVQLYFEWGLDSPEVQQIMRVQQEKANELKKTVLKYNKPDYTVPKWYFENLYLLPDLSDIEWEGDIMLEGCLLFSLKGLPKNVKGELSIVDCDNLRSLEGCPETVGSAFSLRGLELRSLAGCPKKVEMMDVSSLPYIENMEGAPVEITEDLTIRYCSNLSTLKGCPKKIGGDLTLKNLRELTSLDGAPAYVRSLKILNAPITSMKGGLKLAKGDVTLGELLNLENLNGCPEIAFGELNIQTCPNLKSLVGAPDTVRTLKIVDTSSLKNLIGCPQNILWDFEIEYTSIESLEGAPSMVGASVNIVNNTRIKTIGDGFKYVGGSFEIGNAPSLISLDGFPSFVGRSISLWSLKKIENLDALPSKIGGTINVVDMPSDVYKKLDSLKIKIQDPDIAEYRDKKVEELNYMGVERFHRMSKQFDDEEPTQTTNEHVLFCAGKTPVQNLNFGYLLERASTINRIFKI
jgi:hypothetical protein